MAKAKPTEKKEAETKSEVDDVQADLVEMQDAAPIQWYYAPSTNGFYNTDINSTMPQDAISITASQHTALLEGQTEGNTIQIVNGVPTSVPPVITPQQQAVIDGKDALAAGLNISSAGTPALNAVYSLSDTSQGNINAVMTYILLHSKFPQQATQTYWADQSGAIHQFTSVDLFKAFATAVADYVDAVEDYMNSGGQVGALPSANVTII